MAWRPDVAIDAIWRRIYHQVRACWKWAPPPARCSQSCATTGIFPSAAICPSALPPPRARYQLDVVVTDWLDLDVADASLDAIVLLGTFSNLADPGRCLRRARDKLRPDGFLFFNFPAADSGVARLYGEHMWMFTPSVMQFATRQGVRSALERAGLRIEAMRVDRQSPTFAKIAGHARLGVLYPWIERCGLAEAALPFGLPLPGIVAVRARLVPG